MQNTWEPSGRRASETRSEMLSTLALLGGLAGHNHHSTSPISLKFNLSPPKYCSQTCILAFCLSSAMPEGRCHPHAPNLSAPGICTHPAGSVAWGCTREAAALGCCPRPLLLAARGHVGQPAVLLGGSWEPAGCHPLAVLRGCLSYLEALREGRLIPTHAAGNPRGRCGQTFWHN